MTKQEQNEKKVVPAGLVLSCMAAASAALFKSTMQIGQFQPTSTGLLLKLRFFIVIIGQGKIYGGSSQKCFVLKFALKLCFEET